MIDFMVPSIHLCHADVTCRLPPDGVKLLVVYLLYESLLAVTGGSAIKRCIELRCQIENRRSGSRAIFDFMCPTVLLCFADVSCRLPPDSVILLVVYLLYESLQARGRPST